MNANFNVISLTRLGIKPESIAPEAKRCGKGLSVLEVGYRDVPQGKLLGLAE